MQFFELLPSLYYEGLFEDAVRWEFSGLVLYIVLNKKNMYLKQTIETVKLCPRGECFGSQVDCENEKLLQPVA